MASRIVIGMGAVLLGFPALPASGQDASLVCTNAGNSYRVGEFACIAACHGARRLARCDIVHEAATWTYVSDACPSARFAPAGNQALAATVLLSSERQGSFAAGKPGDDGRSGLRGTQMDRLITRTR